MSETAASLHTIQCRLYIPAMSKNIFLSLLIAGLCLFFANNPVNAKDFSEAYRSIRNEFIFSESGAISDSMKKDNPNAYLKSKDRFSEYLSPEEYKALRTSQQSHYGGIGAQLEMTDTGEFLCIPDAGGPAEQSGIRVGDVLYAVNGQPVNGKSLYVVVAMIRGEIGSSVDLTFRRKTLKYTVHIRRTGLRTETVKTHYDYSIPVISIFSFESNTQRDLRVALNVLKDASEIILDLRGNPGGDLHSAIDCAMLFLERNDAIITMQSRRGNTPYKSTNPPYRRDLKLFIWQDKRTASAAEVFTAALVQNGQARSVGPPSYGKGIMQEIIPLSDGSALVLSTAYLKTPDGTLYHEKGLLPTYALGTASPSIEQYLAKVKEIRDTSVVAAVPSPTPDPTTTPEPSPTAVPATPTPTVKPVQESPLQEYFLCFDNEFQQKEEATIRALAIQRSFNTLPDLYLLTLATETSEIFKICFGPLTDREKAEQERERISTGVNLPMTIQTKPAPVPTPLPTSTVTTTAAPAPAPPRSLIPPFPKPDARVQPRTGWGIAIGYFPCRAAYYIKTDLENPPHNVKIEMEEIATSLCRILIGPYEKRNESFLQALKDRGIIPKDAVWIEMKE